MIYDSISIIYDSITFMLDQLPEVVMTALSTTCKSGRSLSWKVQENNKGILIQLVWKAEPVSGPTRGNTTVVASNWKSHPASTRDGVDHYCKSDNFNNTGRPLQKKRICLSRARRNARRLQAFLDQKRHLEDQPQNLGFQKPHAVSQE